MKFTIDNINIKLRAFENQIVSIDELLNFCTENNCSDLYIKLDEQPYINRYGKIRKVPCLPINSIAWNKWADYAITSENNALYVRNKMLDFAYEVDINENSKYYKKYNTFRYRVSAGFSRDKNIATFRMISPDLPSFNTINFPKDIAEKLNETFDNRSGIIIISGATGSGKTTTLAACMNDFTQPKMSLDNKMIITLEDPCEYIYPSSNSVKINQKELGRDFINFGLGVKQSLREHPNVILCGEIRDREVINTTIEAARTGHLVATTIHSDSVAGTVARLMYYLQDGGEDMMFDLIMNLNFIMSQKILADGEKFILETQYLLFTEEIIKHLLNMVEEKKNISRTINALFKNEDLLNNKIIKDWS